MSGEAFARAEYARSMTLYDALLEEATALITPPVPWTRDTYTVSDHAQLVSAQEDVTGTELTLARRIRAAVLDAEAAAYNIWYYSQQELRETQMGKWVYVLGAEVSPTPYEDKNAAVAACIANRVSGPACITVVQVAESPLTLPRAQHVAQEQECKVDELTHVVLYGSETQLARICVNSALAGRRLWFRRGLRSLRLQGMSFDGTGAPDFTDMTPGQEAALEKIVDYAAGLLLGDDGVAPNDQARELIRSHVKIIGSEFAECMATTNVHEHDTVGLYERGIIATMQHASQHREIIVSDEIAKAGGVLSDDIPADEARLISAAMRGRLLVLPQPLLAPAAREVLTARVRAVCTGADFELRDSDSHATNRIVAFILECVDHLVTQDNMYGGPLRGQFFVPPAYVRGNTSLAARMIAAVLVPEQMTALEAVTACAPSLSFPDNSPGV